MDLAETLAAARVESITRYKRAMLRDLDAMGLTPETVMRHYDKDADRYRAWLLESIYAACVAMESWDTVLAFRCALQIAEYQGRLGWFPSPTTHDAAIFIRNELETAIRR